MASGLFGADGVRGLANSEPITAETALKLALAAGARFAAGGQRRRVIIGKDTRLSGYMLETALSAGFLSMGMDVMLLGPIPTPAVGMLARSMRADLGVMISAPERSFEDNGIRLFGGDGFHLGDDVQADIAMRVDAATPPAARAAAAELGRARRLDDARGRYIEFAKSSFPKGLSLAGFKIVVDCANGAACRVAPSVLWELGARVIAIGVEPNGTNINRDCGAMHPDRVKSAVHENGADLGIALDGDGGGLIMVDELGRSADGDQLMALIARCWAAAGRLKGDRVTATVMSSLGLERFLSTHGIALKRTPSGDRCIVEEMRRNGGNLGGEPSGRIVLTDFATTGDGLIAALQVLAALVQANRPASEVLRAFPPLPRASETVACRLPVDEGRVKAGIRAGEAELDGKGRLVVYKSRTGPSIHVVAESEDEKLAARVVADLAAAVKIPGE